MISLQEINKKNFPVTPEIEANLQTLHYRINRVRAEYGKPMVVTTGLRTWDDHVRVYKEKAEKAGIPFDESKVPKKSKHLIGAAVDIFDPEGKLYDWCKTNEKFLGQIGLWCEERMGSWQHFQILPYSSWKPGKSIWFFP